MLDGRKRSALLVDLTREMQRRGSWCGETHIQKAMFFLQELLKVNSGFEFILYRHGPFSFDLRDELLSMRADDLLELAIRQEGYGPTYIPTPFSKEFLERYPKTIARYKAQVEFVAKELKDKRVTDLEKLATAFFIWSRENKHNPPEIVERLIQLKPHITQNDAWNASDELTGLMKRSCSYVFDESSDEQAC
jgi:uncharacterized protein YwgA